MSNSKIAFKIEPQDNVATALTELYCEEVQLRGAEDGIIMALERIPGFTISCATKCEHSTV